MSDELQNRLATEKMHYGRSVAEQPLGVLHRALNSVHPVELQTPIVPLRPIAPQELAAAIREGRE